MLHHVASPKAMDNEFKREKIWYYGITAFKQIYSFRTLNYDAKNYYFMGKNYDFMGKSILLKEETDFIEPHLL